MSTTEADTEFAAPVQEKSLDMVRNILFGEQARENDKRLAMLERFVKVWTSSVRDEMRKNFDSLSHEIHLVNDLLAEESKARLGDSAIARKHFEQSSKGIDGLQKQLQSAQDTLNQRLDQEVTHLSDTIQQQREDLVGQLKQAVEQLRQDKTDRKTLAALLDNVTRQLAGDTV